MQLVRVLLGGLGTHRGAQRVGCLALGLPGVEALQSLAGAGLPSSTRRPSSI